MEHSSLQPALLEALWGYECIGPLKIEEKLQPLLEGVWREERPGHRRSGLICKTGRWVAALYQWGEDKMRKGRQVF